MAEEEKTGRTPAEIRRDIEATRARMGGTLDGLEHRLNPERLKAEASSAIRERTIGRVEHFAGEAGDELKGVGDDVFQTIKSNPIPAALAAIGLGWLIVEGRNNRRMERRFDRMPERMGSTGYYEGADYRYDRPQHRSGEWGAQQYQGQQSTQWQGQPGTQWQGSRNPIERVGDFAGRAGDTVSNAASSAAGAVGDAASSATHSVGHAASSATHTVGHAASSAANTVGDAASSAVNTVGDVASSAADTVSDIASQAGQTVQEFAGNAQDQVGEWAGAAQQTAYRMRSRFEEILDQNPLLIGAAAVALGAAIGMSLPHTSKEDELFGERSDELMDRAQELVSDTAQKVQTVAEHTATKVADVAKETAKDEAQKQGLTGS